MMTGYRWEMDELVRESLDMENLLRLVEEISERKQEAR